MTHFENQTDLEHLNEAELRFKLRQIFNALAGLQTSSQECAQAMASLEEVQRALYRKISCPKP